MTDTDRLMQLPQPHDTPYGPLRAAAFSHCDPLPSRSEVVIIGGGIIGITTAYYLARDNIPVTVIEKARVGCEASSRAFGWVAELLVSPDCQPMTQCAKALWPGLHEDVGETGYRRDGIAYLASDAGEMEAYAAWLDSARPFIGADTRLLSSDQVAKRYPGIAQKFEGGIFSPNDGSVEPIIATAAIAAAARREGARVVTDCAVRGIDLDSGRVSGVFTEKGYVGTSSVFCAANVWTRLLLGNHNVKVPQIHVVMTTGRTGPVNGPVGGGGQETWAFRRQIDGGYSLGGVTGVRAPVTRDALLLYRQFLPMIKALGGGKPDFGKDAIADWLIPRRWDPKKKSPFEKTRVVSSTPRREVSLSSLRNNSAVFPAMETASVEECWAGAIAITPDGAPIIGPVDQMPGLFLATACSYGIGWAPAIGKLYADTLRGNNVEFDLHPFRLSRFFDGSPTFEGRGLH